MKLAPWVLLLCEEKSHPKACNTHCLSYRGTEMSTLLTLWRPNYKGNSVTDRDAHKALHLTMMTGAVSPGPQGGPPSLQGNQEWGHYSREGCGLHFIALDSI